MSSDLEFIARLFRNGTWHTRQAEDTNEVYEMTERRP